MDLVFRRFVASKRGTETLTSDRSRAPGRFEKVFVADGVDEKLKDRAKLREVFEKIEANMLPNAA